MRFQLTPETLTPFIISNAVALAILWFSLENKAVAKKMISILFVVAGFFNLYMAFQNPAAYCNFADMATHEWLKTFIRGLFAEYTTTIVSAISIAQVYIGISIMKTGRRFMTGCIGGIIFGLAIAPLGVGSAFPSSLVLSIAFLVLLVSQAIEDLEEAKFDY